MLLKVMTVNVRQPDLDDGPNGWELRRDVLVNTILEAGPDLIGTQELFTLQADYISAKARRQLMGRLAGAAAAPPVTSTSAFSTRKTACA
jgi:hypothetical protein